MFANCLVTVTTALMVTTVNVKTKNMSMIERRLKFNQKKAMVISRQHEQTFKNSGKALKIWLGKMQ